jgi:biotin transport system substrate-specific component
VPITLQTFFVILCGFVEGPRAFFAGLLYVLAGLAGLPVFAGGNTGPGFLFGPTAGFAFAFPLAALVSGAARMDPRPWRYILFGALGSVLIYLSGMAGLHVNMDLSWTKSFYTVLVFLPGDGIKVLAASAAMTGLLKGSPGLLRALQGEGRAPSASRKGDGEKAGQGKNG